MSLFLTENFVWWYCGIIVAFAFSCAGALAWQARPLHRRLRRVCKRLEHVDGEQGFVSAFDEYNRHAEEAFGLPWKEFVETLVLPEPDSGAPIRNTGEVSRYLNDATIIFPRIPFGFYQAVPNLLTGVGILGTFLGLAAGVGSASSGLSSSNPVEITVSLQQLLSGASLAFWTSIVGIVCSILFVVGERFSSRKLHKSLGEWVGSIESRLERVTPEGVALKQLEQATRTTKQLERFNSELIFSIEQALEEKIAGRLSPQLERLVEAVEGLRVDRSTDSGRMIQETLERFTAAMQERTGSQFDEMAKIVADLNRTLKDSADGMAQSQRDIRTALDSVMTTVMTSMDAGATAMTKSLQQSLNDVTRIMADASQQLAKRMTDASTAAVTKLRDTIEPVTENLAKTGVEAASKISGSLHGLQAAADSLAKSTLQSEQALTGMTTFVDRINTLCETIEAAHRQIAGVAEPIGRAAGEIRASSDKAAEAMRRTSELVGHIDSVVNTLEQHQKTVVGTWDRYRDRFERIDGSLAQVFQQLEVGLSGYCEQVAKFVNELDGMTSKITQDLAGATSELDSSIQDLSEHLRRRV